MSTHHESSSTLPVHDVGIFHSLPTFPPSRSGYTAIVTGANGISGFHTMRVLLESPDRWKKVYALSRRPPPPEMMNLLSASQRSRVQHVAVDFLSSPEKIAEAMKAANVTANYAFFYSYFQPRPPPGSAAWSNAQELVEVNSALLRNFLNALPLANIQLNRFLLQTGAKNYGAHLGTIRAPACESDPQPEHIEPNFYYPQEKLLFAYCKSNPETSWNVVRPAWIIGAVNNAQMNALHPFAVYAAVCAQRGVTMAFPGTWEAWQAEFHHSTAMLTGYLSEWAVLEDKCRNQAFNAVDGGPLPWNRFWPELARWYGVKEIGTPELDDSKMTIIEGRDPKNTPMGYGPKQGMKFAFSMVQWAKDPENQKAWKEIMAKHNLSHNPFDDVEANFTFGDGAFLAFPSLCMNKARRLGWTGFVDTIESLWLMYDEMNRLGMLPPMLVKDPRPLI